MKHWYFVVEYLAHSPESSGSATLIGPFDSKEDADSIAKVLKGNTTRAWYVSE